MKLKVLITGLIVLLILASCSMGFLDDSPTQVNTEENSGTIRITVPLISSRITSALSSAGLEKDASARTLSSRALMIADRVEFELFNNIGGLVDSWTLFNTLSGGDDLSYVTEGRLVTTGTGYTLYANVYNEDVSDTEPVVSGSLSGIDIAVGVTTNAYITCVPNLSTYVYESVSTTLSMPPSVYDFSTDQTYI